MLEVLGGLRFLINVGGFGQSIPNLNGFENL
jgi:hypothetical protein